MKGRLRLLLLLLPAMLLACSGEASPTVPPATATVPAASVAAQAATAPSVVVTATVAPTAVPTTTRAAATASTPVSSATAPVVASPATPTRASTATGSASSGMPGAATPVSPATPQPIGAAPSGWQTYRGNARVPFAIYFPPDWTVDESRAHEGRIYFYGPGVREPFEDSLWVLIATTGKVEQNANIDALREQYFNNEVKTSHPEAGVDVTRANEFSGLTFASIGATFNSNAQLCYAYIGLGLRSQVPWRFRLNSLYSDYNQQLETVFAPMIGSLQIYANP